MSIQIADQPLHARVRVIAEQAPVEFALIIPFADFRDLAAHEQQFLAGMAPHQRIARAQIGEALPAVARHLAEHRTFAVHDFVVRERQHEVFRKGV